MSKRRTAIFVSVFCIAVLAIVLIGAIVLLDIFIPKAYSFAKRESTDILEDVIPFCEKNAKVERFGVNSYDY